MTNSDKFCDGMISEEELADIDRTNTYRGLDMSEAVRPLIENLRIARRIADAASKALAEAGVPETVEEAGVVTWRSLVVRIRILANT